jgi:hypothetical protein
VSGLSPPGWAGGDWLVLGSRAFALRSAGRVARFSGELFTSHRHPVVAYASASAIYIKNLESGAEKAVPLQRLGEYPLLSWSPNGDHLLIHARDSDETALWLLPQSRTLATTPRLIAQSTSADSALSARFTPGSTWIWHSRAARTPSGCHPNDRPAAVDGPVRCTMEWIASTAHHIATGHETQFAPAEEIHHWATNDLLFIDPVSRSTAPTELVIRRARGSRLEAIARIPYSGQVTLAWQP